MHSLRQHVEHALAHPFDDETFARVEGFFETDSYPRRAEVLIAGRTVRHMYYVESGLIHAYVTQSDGSTTSMQFASEDCTGCRTCTDSYRASRVRTPSKRSRT